MKKTPLLSAATLAGVAPLSEAVVTFHDIEDIELSYGESVFIDLDLGLASKNYLDVPLYDRDIRINYAYSALYAGTFGQAAYSGWQVSQTGSRASRFTYGEALNFDSTAAYQYISNGGDGPWGGDTGAETAYLGYTNGSTNAWLAIRYDSINNTFTVESFAFGPNSELTHAGAVPEPAETAAGMALLAGCAAIYQRRKTLRKVVA